MPVYKKDTQIEYIKTGNQYSVFSDSDKTEVHAPVSNDPKWIDGVILETQGKIIAVPINQTEHFIENQPVAECLIKEVKNPHDNQGLIYTGIDKNDGKEKHFARAINDISGFKIVGDNKL